MIRSTPLCLARKKETKPLQPLPLNRPSTNLASARMAVGQTAKNYFCWRAVRRWRHRCQGLGLGYPNPVLVNGVIGTVEHIVYSDGDQAPRIYLVPCSSGFENTMGHPLLLLSYYK